MNAQHCIGVMAAEGLNSAFSKSQLQFWLDFINWAFKFTINIISLISIGSGAKEFYFRHIANASTSDREKTSFVNKNVQLDFIKDALQLIQTAFKNVAGKVLK